MVPQGSCGMRTAATLCPYCCEPAQIAGRSPNRRHREAAIYTGTVLGLFEDWRCEMGQVDLAPGDTLVLYTDELTEAASGDGEEFGESRLL